MLGRLGLEMRQHQKGKRVRVRFEGLLVASVIEQFDDRELEADRATPQAMAKPIGPPIGPVVAKNRQAHRLSIVQVEHAVVTDIHSPSELAFLLALNFHVDQDPFLDATKAPDLDEFVDGPPAQVGLSRRLAAVRYRDFRGGGSSLSPHGPPGRRRRGTARKNAPALPSRDCRIRSRVGFLVAAASGSRYARLLVHRSTMIPRTHSRSDHLMSKTEAPEVTPKETRPVNVAAIAAKILANVEKVIIGKRQQILLALVAYLCEGHILLEDVPGVAKTMLARALARSVGCTFKRIQCTPDLLPTDVTGVSIFNPKTTEFEFRAGPIFAQTVLADEINRATPRTQSALLEAMAERPRHGGRADLCAQAAVPGHRHAEPDRPRGHVSAARGPTRPLPGPARASAIRPPKKRRRCSQRLAARRIPSTISIPWSRRRTWSPVRTRSARSTSMTRCAAICWRSSRRRATRRRAARRQPARVDRVVPHCPGAWRPSRVATSCCPTM